MIFEHFVFLPDVQEGYVLSQFIRIPSILNTEEGNEHLA